MSHLIFSTIALIFHDFRCFSTGLKNSSAQSVRKHKEVSCTGPLHDSSSSSSSINEHRNAKRDTKNKTKQNKPSQNNNMGIFSRKQSARLSQLYFIQKEKHARLCQHNDIFLWCCFFCCCIRFYFHISIFDVHRLHRMVMWRSLAIVLCGYFVVFFFVFSLVAFSLLRSDCVDV